MKVNFVDTKYLKANTAIEDNTDDSKLTPYIVKAQDVKLMPMLGETFYNHLVQGVVNNTLTPVEDALIRNYIQPMVAEWSYYFAYPYLSIKSTNKGAVKQNSEWSESADLKEMKFIRDDIHNIADLYSIRLRNELHRGYVNGIYPLAMCFYQDNPIKSSKASFGGIYVPRRRDDDDFLDGFVRTSSYYD
jgi:hypothetical protein